MVFGVKFKKTIFGLGIISLIFCVFDPIRSIIYGNIKLNLYFKDIIQLVAAYEFFLGHILSIVFSVVLIIYFAKKKISLKWFLINTFLHIFSLVYFFLSCESPYYVIIKTHMEQIP